MLNDILMKLVFVLRFGSSEYKKRIKFRSLRHGATMDRQYQSSVGKLQRDSR